MAPTEGFSVKPEGQLKRLRKNIEKINKTIERQEAMLEIASENSSIDLNRLTSLEMALKYFKSCKAKYEQEVKRLTKQQNDKTEEVENF